MKIDERKSVKNLTPREKEIMVDIITSSISIEEKAERLYNMYDYETFFDIYSMYIIDATDKVGIERMNIIADFYKLCQNNNLFKKAANKYKILNSEMITRLESLKDICITLDSNMPEDVKSARILFEYISERNFKTKFVRFLHGDQADLKIKEYLPYIKRIPEIINLFKEYENNGQLAKFKEDYKWINYLALHNKALENYDYADYVINCYINDNEAFILKNFLRKMNICLNTFDFCVDTVSLLNPILKQKLEEKRAINNQLFIDYYKNNIRIINDTIAAGNINGRPFDAADFFELVPFTEYEKHFTVQLRKFLEKNIDFNIDYFYQMYNSKTIRSGEIFSERTILNSKKVINGVEITEEDNMRVFNYIEKRKLPKLVVVYNALIKRQINGQLEEAIEIVEEKISNPYELTFKVYSK